MRLEGYVLSALMVAASAAIFGDLGRAAAPDEAEAHAQTPQEMSTASLSPPAGLAAADPCAPRATALRFLDQGAYASDATSGCALR
ncbi:hypothetical protein V5G24_04450 [Xanthobacter sp. VTT E-85241]|uniref:hypothetical protein n=1 Tax=Roseixanthobacter finlandensis TaxID=3119922 RepID=UPI0037261AB3